MACNADYGIMNFKINGVSYEVDVENLTIEHRTSIVYSDDRKRTKRRNSKPHVIGTMDLPAELTTDDITSMCDVRVVVEEANGRLHIFPAASYASEESFDAANGQLPFEFIAKKSFQRAGSSPE